MSVPFLRPCKHQSRTQGLNSAPGHVPEIRPRVRSGCLNIPVRENIHTGGKNSPGRGPLVRRDLSPYFLSKSRGLGLPLKKLAWTVFICKIHSNTIYPWFLSKTKPKLAISHRHRSRCLRSLNVPLCLHAWRCGTKEEDA